MSTNHPPQKRVSRKQLIEDYKKGVVNSDYNVFHCKENDQYTVRKKTAAKSPRTKVKVESLVSPEPQRVTPNPRKPPDEKKEPKGPSLNELKQKYLLQV
jgi:hypothetical protein